VRCFFHALHSIPIWLIGPLRYCASRSTAESYGGEYPSPLLGCVSRIVFEVRENHTWIGAVLNTGASCYVDAHRRAVCFRLKYGQPVPNWEWGFSATVGVVFACMARMVVSPEKRSWPLLRQCGIGLLGSVMVHFRLLKGFIRYGEHIPLILMGRYVRVDELVFCLRSSPGPIQSNDVSATAVPKACQQTDEREALSQEQPSRFTLIYWL